MRKVFLLLLLSSFIASCKKEEKTSKLLTHGISYDLAQFRKQQVSDVHYALDFHIPNTKGDKIASTLTLNLNISDVSKDLYLDFNEQKTYLKSIKANAESIEVLHEKEHVIIPKANLKKGANTIQISFNLGELSLNRNDEFLYTLLVPDRASTLFPCFDQPDIKATYTLNVTAPKDWKVLCGAFEEKQIEKGDFIQHQFRETDKMSTYLFSFVAGKFTEEIRNPGAFDMKMLYRENNPEKIDESMSEIYSVHQKSVDFLEEYTAYPFPFQKMDFAAIPSFQYGGMEHVGAIQYRQSSLFLDKNATQSRKLGRAKLIAHETSHMWFGDLVTMKWFNDVWMKEVFANFMADKIMNPVFPEVNHDLSFMMTHYPRAYGEDRTGGTNPIRQELDNLKNAGSLYGAIIYNKAPIMMRQLEYLLGKEAFKKGIQEYIKTYANGNADWNELVSIFDKKSEKDITKWSEIWVNSSGRPVFTEDIAYENGKITSMTIRQKAEDGSDKIWGQSFKIGLKYNDDIKVFDVPMLGSKLELKEVVGLPKPNQIIYNYDGFGYGVFPSQTASIKEISSEVARGYAYINVYENMLSGNISATKAYDLFLKGIAVEKNELITNYLSGVLQTIFWRFLSPEKQMLVQSDTEKKMLELIQSAIPANKKRILFSVYRSVAFSEEGKKNLYQIWNKNLRIPGLRLNENDFTTLAMRLAIFKHEKANEILKEQEKRISNKDRLTRYQWLLPSVSEDASVRDDFMRSLAKTENREKESWVTTALNNIHHPLRQETSTKHVKMCVELLEEIQLTGDIFFPKRWLVSSVGNYASKEAYEVIVTFLAEHPNYNPVLKKKLLQSIDNLKRAQAIRE